MKLVLLKGGRLLRGGETAQSSGHVPNVLGSGIMKRNLLKKLGISKKWGLSLMLAGFAALNVGFTNQIDKIETTPAAKVEAAVASFANLNEYVSNIDTDRISANVEVPDVETENIEYVGNSGIEEKVQPLYYDDYGYGDYVAVMTMEATAYLPTDGDGYGITATGIPATYGVVAVDPSIIPLGSRLYIPGYGEAIAADTGGAIVGYRIDLCMESYDECMQFGRRDVTVYVLSY